MSVADCYTDFHIDFGGSSVFYHILKGKKTFFFIPPHDKHLKKYEEWCLSPAQNWTFLGDQTKECYRVDLSEGDTMLIPAGWIHAVWTPEDSLVIGGNFLTRMHYDMQIRIAQIEKNTSVARKFRYPYFQKLLWYAALKYLEEDPIPDSVVESLLSGQCFTREVPTYMEFDAWGECSHSGLENFHARYYSKAELEGLPGLARYLQRTALIAMGIITEGITVETRNAVKRSIPKGHGEPLDVVKKFAWWYTWKRGNELIPHWAYPDHVPESGAPEVTEKKLSAAALRRLDREAALQAWRVAPDRQSTRMRFQPQNLYVEMMNANTSGDATPRSKDSAKASSPAPLAETNKTPKRNSIDSIGLADGLSPPKKRKTANESGSSAGRRPACETCRKRRRACKHRDEVAAPMEPGPGLGSMNALISAASVDAAQTPLPSDQLPLHLRNEMASPECPGGERRGPLQVSHIETLQSGLGVEHNTEKDPSAVPSRDANVKAVVPIDSASSSISASSPLKTPGRNKACKDCRRSKVFASSAFRNITLTDGVFS
jgi:F-box and leucine-rich repeat protein 10/11